MNKRYIISTLLGVLFLLPLLWTHARAFVDVPVTHSSLEAITYLQKQNVLKGVDTDHFAPDASVTRAAALKIVLEAADRTDNREELGTVHFNDVPADAWFYPYVEMGLSYGIISGDKDTFDPGRNVNKAEFLKMLFQAFEIDTNGYNYETLESLVDVPDAVWFTDFFQFAVQFQIISIDENQNAYPDAILTRADVAQITFQTLFRGQGLDTQIMLQLAEEYSIAGMEAFQERELTQSALLLKKAESFSLLAAANNQSAVIQQSHNIIISMQHIVHAASLALLQSHDEALSNTQSAWGLAQEATLNGTQAQIALGEQLKNLAHDLADQIRTLKQ